MPVQHATYVGADPARPWFLPGYYIVFELAARLRAIATEPWAPSTYAAALGLRRFGIVVADQVYRSAEPTNRLHWGQIERLGVRTLVCVNRTSMRADTRATARALGLSIARVSLGPDDAIVESAVRAAAGIALDPANGPVLLHGDDGRHRVGIAVAGIRRLTGWTLADALAEYERFAEPTPRACDRVAIAAEWR
jgi:protein tyrosine/serine phosphatase